MTNRVEVLVQNLKLRIQLLGLSYIFNHISSFLAEAVSVLQKDVDKLEQSIKVTEDIDEKIEKLEETMGINASTIEIREGLAEDRIENLTNLVTNIDGESHPGKNLRFIEYVLKF